MRLKEFNPTALDPKGLGPDERMEWEVLSTICRDSSAREKSAFYSRSRNTKRKNREILRYRHWACGWVEVLIEERKVS